MRNEKPQLIPTMDPVNLSFVLKEQYLPEFTASVQEAAQEIVQSDSPEAVIFAISSLYKTIKAWELSACAAETLKKRIDPEY